MKRQIITALIFIATYTLLLTITWGDHNFSLPLMLLTVFIVSYFFFKKNSFTLKNYLLLNLPLASLFIIALLLGGHVKTLLLYLLLVPLSSFLGNSFNRFLNNKSIFKNT